MLEWLRRIRVDTEEFVASVRAQQAEHAATDKQGSSARAASPIDVESASAQKAFASSWSPDSAKATDSSSSVPSLFSLIKLGGSVGLHRRPHPHPKDAAQQQVSKKKKAEPSWLQRLTGEILWLGNRVVQLSFYLILLAVTLSGTA